MTAPNRFIPDRNESVCVAFHNLESPGDFALTFTLSAYARYDYRRSGFVNKTLQVVNTRFQPTTSG